VTALRPRSRAHRGVARTGGLSATRHLPVVVVAAALALAAACSDPPAGSLTAHDGTAPPGATSGGEADAATGDPGNADAGTVPFEPQPPEAYVGRVKNLVNGGAATSAELAAVKADPSALKGLVDGWMNDDGFRQKMLRFFTTAFQQSRINHETIGEQNGEEFFANPTRLFANLQEMMARTAWNVAQTGKPWSDVVSSREYMMTTATESYLLYLDVDYGTIVADRHTFFHAPPADRPAPPWSLDYELANKVWWTSEDFTVGPAGKSCPDPNTLSSFWLLNFMHGALHCNGYYHSLTPTFTDADYNDWHPVTVSTARATAAPPRFYDLPVLRGAKTLALRQPRVGFFTTPAFFATWPTNASNAHRVTINQALIVALGKSVDGEDVTIPQSGGGGLDGEHAKPGTACFGCHQVLDPMRNYFRAGFNDRYRPQTDTALAAQVGSFAFDGVTKTGGDLLDFARTLGAHPAFAGAWAQKLCYYANTVGCDADDPEFVRVLAAFRASNLDFKTLVRELFSSPLVTGAKPLLTWSRQPFPISMMRRQHVCAMLSTRLGVSNACDPMLVLDTYGKPKFSPATLATTLLPDDGFGRASVRPFLATVPDMFYRGSVEVLCEALADELVDVPNARFTSAKADAALADLVHVVMGLPDNDARAADMRSILDAHLAAATGAGATPTQALKSAFTLACTSPFTVALGF
jgi:hypothetical protein